MRFDKTDAVSEIVEELADIGNTVSDSRLSDRFGVNQPLSVKSKDRRYPVSLLYCFGVFH